MEEKRTRGPSLQTQLAQALLDAQALQQQPIRGESYISEMKLVTARILTLERLIRRKENSTLRPLKDENAKLKQEVAALKLDLETLKAQPQPAVPAAPEAPATNSTVERMLEAAAKMGKKKSARAPEVKVTPSKGDSIDRELVERNVVRVPLTPPRPGGENPDTLAQPSARYPAY